MILQGGFVILDIVFGCGNATCNPSPVRELSLLTQFLGIITLQSLVLEKQCNRSFVGRVTNSHITTVHLAGNCGKTECWAPVTHVQGYSP